MSLVLQTGYGERLTYWLAPLVWIRHPLYSSDWSWCYPIARSDIFKRTLGSAPRVRPVSSLVAGPYSVLDVSPDFQATQIIPLREFLKLETDSADLNGKRIIQADTPAERRAVSLFALLYTVSRLHAVKDIYLYDVTDSMFLCVGLEE